MQLIAVYLHVNNCLVIIIEYKSALHAMTLMGGAAASETLIGGYIWTIGGAAPPKDSLERTLDCSTHCHICASHCYLVMYTSGSPGAGSLDHEEQLVASQNSLCSHSRH